MRYVFAEIFGLFLVDPKDPKMIPKIVKTVEFSDFQPFYTIFVKFSIDFVV